MILYVNACVREKSRTDKIARQYLKKRVKESGQSYTELYLPKEDIKPLSEEALENRTSLIEKGDYSDVMFDYAKQFANADEIVIAAPFWDGSFPAILKVYIENIYVTGIVTKFSEEGRPIGLCKAKNLTYVTSAGGQYMPDFSYEYIKCLANVSFGIENTRLIKAEMLDIWGVDAKKIVEEVVNEL